MAVPIRLRDRGWRRDISGAPIGLLFASQLGPGPSGVGEDISSAPASFARRGNRRTLLSLAGYTGGTIGARSRAAGTRCPSFPEDPSPQSLRGALRFSRYRSSSTATTREGRSRPNMTARYRRGTADQPVAVFPATCPATPRIKASDFGSDP